ARAFVREAARRGAAVTLAGRDVEDLQASAADARLRGAAQARVLPCDVTDAGSIAACAAQAALPDTQLNVLVAAGTMPAQAAMDDEPALLAAMIDANYAGPVALLQALAPRFEQQRG